MKIYKREGRRFVQTTISQPVDNAGKYYQKDGTFSDIRTEESIGLCIVSYATHHVVMWLDEINGSFTHKEAIKVAKNYFNGKGEVPQLDDLLRAIVCYREKLNFTKWRDYRAILASNHFAAYASSCGFANGYATSYAAADGALRPIVNIKQ